MNIARIIIAKIVIVIFLAIVVFCSDIPRAIAGDYMGEFCFTLQETENESGPVTTAPYTFRVGITSMGNNNYTFQGTVQVTDDNPAITGGTGVIIGDDIFVTMETSQQHLTNPWLDSSAAQVHLTLSTLNGTYWTNGMTFNTQTRVTSTFYRGGTVTFTTCP